MIKKQLASGRRLGPPKSTGLHIADGRDAQGSEVHLQNVTARGHREALEHFDIRYRNEALHLATTEHTNPLIAPGTPADGGSNGPRIRGTKLKGVSAKIISSAQPHGDWFGPLLRCS